MRRQNSRMAAALVAAAVAVALPVRGEVAPGEGLSLDGAKRVIAAAAAESRAHEGTGVIAVVDAGGHLLAAERLDGTFPAGGPISIGKARTAALFERPTRFFEELVNGGRTAMTTIDGFTPLIGGVPLVVGGRVVGGVGVSGAASAARDEEIALAGAAALAEGSAAPLAVSHLDAAAVRSAFAQGRPLLETRQYKIHASRRDGPGMAEVHVRDTDIVYVLEGTATLVTGGSVVEPATVAPDEIRGPAIEGGVSRSLVPGDVVVVPDGVPHWFQQVEPPFLYYVVKTTR